MKKLRNQINEHPLPKYLRFIVNEPITYSIYQSVKQFSDNQSISGMKTFQIQSDKNIYIYTFKNVIDGHHGLSSPKSIVYIFKLGK